MKKYEFTGETRRFSGHVLKRIVALRDFGVVRKGNLGGWVEKEDNLSHEGSAWVHGDAKVYGNTRVTGNAWVMGNAWVSGHAKVSGNAWVSDTACVTGNARVDGNARVGGGALVIGTAGVMGNAHIDGNALVESSEEYSVFKNTWSSFRHFTYTSSNRMWKVGCFYGTGDELIKKAYADSQLSGKCYEVIVRAQEAIEKIKGDGK